MEESHNNNKGFMIADMPESCETCDYRIPVSDMTCHNPRLKDCTCIFNRDHTVHDYKAGEPKPAWCPFKPMPEKQHVDLSTCCPPGSAVEIVYMSLGWNACIDKMFDLAEKKEE